MSLPTLLPFLVPSLPEEVIHNIFALASSASTDSESDSNSIEIFSLPALSSPAHITKAFEAALEATNAVVDVRLHGSQDGLLQVEGGHAQSHSAVTPLFSHAAGSAIALQCSRSTSATLTLSSADQVARILQGWPTADAPRWPSNNILSHAELHELQRPALHTAQMHADQWMAAFEAPAPQEPAPDTSGLSKRAQKKLATENAAAMKLVRKLAKKQAKAVEADGGEWTMVGKGGREMPASKNTLSTQTDQLEVATVPKKRKEPKMQAGLRIDSKGNVAEVEGAKKSKFMPESFYRNKKEDKRKLATANLQADFKQDQAQIKHMQQRSSRRYKPY